MASPRQTTKAGALNASMLQGTVLPEAFQAARSANAEITMNGVQSGIVRRSTFHTVTINQADKKNPHAAHAATCGLMFFVRES